MRQKLTPEPASPPQKTPKPTWYGRLLAWVAMFALGGVFGVLGTIAHQAHLGLWPVLPVGLVLALAAILALMIGVRLVAPARVLVLATALGVIGAVMLLSARGPGGSVLVPDNMLGVVWSIAPAVISLGVVIWPRLPTSASA